MVQRGGQRQRITTGGLAAAVVQRHLPAPLAPALVADGEVAVAGLDRVAGGFDLDVGLRAGHALQVLQRLLHVAQVEHVAGLDRQRVGQPHLRRTALAHADRVDASRHHGQAQHAGGQVLGRGQHARGDEAFLDQRVLQPRDQRGHAGGAQAAADRGVVALRAVQRADLAGHAGLVLDAVQLDPGDEETGRLVVAQALTRGGRAGAQAHVGFALQRLALLRLALLLELALRVGVDLARRQGLTPGGFHAGGERRGQRDHRHCRHAGGRARVRPLVLVLLHPLPACWALFF